MSERRDDRQLRLSLQTRRDAESSKVDSSQKTNSVTDLGRIRSQRHGTTVLERVIREGFTKPVKS